MSITSFGWGMNLIVFLIEEFNIKNIAAAQISNIVNGVVNMLPVVAAILADSFFGNIPVISASTFISLTVSLALTNSIMCFDIKSLQVLKHFSGSLSLDLNHIFGLLDT